MLASWLSRPSTLRKKDDFLLIAPLIVPLYWMLWYGGITEVNGFPVLNELSLPCRKPRPCKTSVPGLVRISIRPYPILSNSAEKGFWLMRISRIADFGGSVPPVNPSMRSEEHTSELQSPMYLV